MDEDYNTELHVHYGFLYEQVQSLKHREHDLQNKEIYGKRKKRFKAPDKERSRASSKNHEKENNEIPKKELKVQFIPKFI